MKARGSGTSGTMGGLGEWGFLKSLLPGLSKKLSPSIVVGPGDDAALVRVGSSVLAITTDMMVEGVHFRTAWTSGEDLGHKIVAMNLSDLAAMGDVKPTVGVLSAGIPPETPVSFIQGFYKGFRRLADRNGFELVGGDTVRSDRMTFSLTALGQMGGPAFKRSGARVGDALMVTGTLGDAAAGLVLLENKKRRHGPESFLLNRLRRPEPRLVWARTLAKTRGVTACLDSSDGFWRSVLLLGAASGVGAEIWADRLPVSSALQKWAGERAADYALTGGEDYELVFTVKPADVRRIELLGFSRVVGQIVPSRQGINAFHAGRKREVPSGFEHFNR